MSFSGAESALTLALRIRCGHHRIGSAWRSCLAHGSEGNSGEVDSVPRVWLPRPPRIPAGRPRRRLQMRRRLRRCCAPLVRPLPRRCCSSSCRAAPPAWTRCALCSHRRLLPGRPFCSPLEGHHPVGVAEDAVGSGLVQGTAASRQGQPRAAVCHPRRRLCGLRLRCGRRRLWRGSNRRGSRPYLLHCAGCTCSGCLSSRRTAPVAVSRPQRSVDDPPHRRQVGHRAPEHGACCKDHRHNQGQAAA